MVLSEFVQNSFNKHIAYFYLLILDEETKIYDSLEESLIISQASDVKYQTIKILEIIDFEPELRLKVQLPNGKDGYFAPKNSVVMIPKERTQVVMIKNVNLSNDLNLHLKIDIDYLESKRDKVLYSKQYVIFNDKIFECLVSVDEIVGFVEQKNINNLHRYETEFKIVNNTTTYRDSAMNNSVTVLKDQNKIFKSQYVISNEDKIRLKQRGKNVWIDRKDTDLKVNIKDKLYADINELFIDSILYQYEQKIEDYHKYYNKVIDQK